jgi:hypothetical protein
MAFPARTLLSLAGALALVAGCDGARTARIYDARTGGSATLVVDDSERSSGRLNGTLPSGEACFGSYSEVTAGKVAVLTCGAHGLLQCKIAARGAADVGYGTCRDAGGAEYDVFF